MIFLTFYYGHDLHVHFQGHANTFKIIPKVKTLTAWLHFQCNVKGHDFFKVMKTLRGHIKLKDHLLVTSLPKPLIFFLRMLTIFVNKKITNENTIFINLPFQKFSH